MMKEMEEIRKSGVCNMLDRVCVCGELQDRFGIYVDKNEFRQILKDYMKWDK
jgi:hypothetical protein